MEWVSGFSRNEEGRLCVVTQDENGVKELVSPGAFKSDLRCDDERCLPVHVRLREGKTVSTKDYLNAIGAPTLEARGQKTYVFSDAKYSVVIPAQVLVYETIATLREVKQLMLTPSSPRRFVTVFSANDEMRSVQPLYKGHKKLLAQSQIERLAWIQQYPSTEAFWSSVYLSALKGRLSPRLPKVNLNARLRGKLINRTLYVTRVGAAQLVAVESPHEFICKNAASWISI